MDISKPILVLIFLKHYGLLVDMRSKRLTDSLTQLKIQGTISPVTSSPSSLLAPKAIGNGLLRGYCWIFQQLHVPYNNDMAFKRDVTHNFETKGPPVYPRPHRLLLQWHMMEPRNDDGARNNPTLIRQVGFSSAYGA